MAKWAEEKGLEVAKPADTSELNRHLLASQPQLIITCAYGRIIPVELLHGPRFGWINLHFSLLYDPEFYKQSNSHLLFHNDIVHLVLVHVL